jgi:hypothetical protein
MKEGPREQQLREMREASFARKRKGADRPNTSPELEAAFAILLPKAKSSDGAQGAHQSSKDDARETKRPEMDAGAAPSPSDSHSGAPLQPRGEPVQSKPTQPTGSPNKRGRPKKGEVRDKPWEAAGISKAQWYRRQKESKT